MEEMGRLAVAPEAGAHSPVSQQHWPPAACRTHRCQRGLSLPLGQRGRSRGSQGPQSRPWCRETREGGDCGGWTASLGEGRGSGWALWAK